MTFLLCHLAHRRSSGT